MDYSEFVTAVQNDDEAGINIYYKKIFRILTRYLMVHTGADLAEAEDVAQMAVMNTISSIKDGNITIDEKIIGYMITTAKNIRVRTLQQESKYQMEDAMENMLAEQQTAYHHLVDKEKQRALRECLAALSKDLREYIDYFFEYPGVDAAAVAKRFKMSTANVWVKKHRVVKQLRECVIAKT